MNRRHFPRLAPGRHDDPAVNELVRARSSDRSISAIHEGPATLELFDAPGEEHAALAPVRVGKGFRFTFAYTVDDLETVGGLGWTRYGTSSNGRFATRRHTSATCRQPPATANCNIA